MTTTYRPLLEALQHRLDAALTTAENAIEELEAKATQLTDSYVTAVTELKPRSITRVRRQTST